MSLIARVRHIIADNQILLVLFGLMLGVVFPTFFQPLAAYSTALLMIIFFTSSLRLRLHEIIGYTKDWKMLSIANFVMLIFTPIVLWIPTAIFAPDWALAFLIVGAMPTGLTIALIADLFGGNMSLAMLVSATTSLLSPLTIPLILHLVVGQSIPIPVFSLFGTLFLTIVIPFLLAMVIKTVAKKQVEKSDLVWREISLVLFALLVAGIVADTVKGAPLTLGWNELGIVISMIICMGGIAWLSFGLTNWRKANERMTIALCMVYMNNTLALYVGDTFFHEQNVVPKLLVILTAVNALLPPIKWFASRVLSQKKKNALLTTAQPVL